MHVVCPRRTDHFKWSCVNLLIGLGDAYSTDSAKAFETAAIDNDIDICTKATYETGSSDMRATIKQIIDDRCCLVTVLFGQLQDISSLLLAAHKQNYAGELVMPDAANIFLAPVVSYLRKYLDESSIHRLLRGMF